MVAMFVAGLILGVSATVVTIQAVVFILCSLYILTRPSPPSEARGGGLRAAAVGIGVGPGRSGGEPVAAGRLGETKLGKTGSA